MHLHNPLSRKSRAARRARRIARRHRDFSAKMDHTGDNAHASMFGIRTDGRPR